MQNISLGDYKGGRDTLNAALGQAYEPLNAINAAAMNYGNTGLASIGKRLASHETAVDTLHGELEKLGYSDQLAQQALDRKVAMEGEVTAGEEDAMLQHAMHMYSLLSPEDQAKNSGWLRSMQESKGKGSSLYRKGKMNWSMEHGTDEALSLIKAQAAAAQKASTEPVKPVSTVAPKANSTPLSNKHKIRA